MRVATLVSATDRGDLLTSLVAGEGSASHAWLHSFELNAAPTASSNIADLLHLLTLLHGRRPGLVELVADNNAWPGADSWLKAVARGFANERGNLGALIAAAGPSPSTPGEAATAQAILAQHQALVTIASSDRFGCAIGAVAALCLDWLPLRATMETAADRLGAIFAPCTLPGEEETVDLLNALPERPRLDRTLAFGARQVLAHHHCLLDLLATRAGARAEI